MNRNARLFLALAVGVWFGGSAVLAWDKFSTPSKAQHLERFY